MNSNDPKFERPFEMTLSRIPIPKVFYLRLSLSTFFDYICHSLVVLRRDIKC
jgi:hypothetical protein